MQSIAPASFCRHTARGNCSELEVQMEQVRDQILVDVTDLFMFIVVNGSKSSCWGDSLCLVELGQQLIWLCELNIEIIVYLKPWAKPVRYLAYSFSKHLYFS